MPAYLDLRSLRDASPSEAAAQLRSTALMAANDNSHHIELLTNEIVSSVADGSLPFTVADTWLSVVRNVQATAICLRQTQSILIRRVAVRQLCRALRRNDTFTTAWNAIGGAAGLAGVLASFSVWDARRLCHALSCTATSGGADDAVRLDRQRGMTELLDILLSQDDNPDQRPLHAAYARLVPACTDVVALKWLKMIDSRNLLPSVQALAALSSDEVSFEAQLQAHILKAHWDVVKQRARQDIFSSGPEAFTLDSIKPFLSKDDKFAAGVFHDLAEHDALMRVHPESFVEALVIPVLRRAARHRSDPDAFTRIGHVLVACLERRPALRKNILPNLHKETDKSLLSAATRSWNSSPCCPKDDEVLGQLLRFILKERLDLPLDFLIDMVRPSRRYKLLQIVLRNFHAYEVDIGPPTSKIGIFTGKAKLPVHVFESLPAAQASALFERLLDGNGDITFLDWSSKDNRNSVLVEPLDYYDMRFPNPHIFRAELIKRTNPKHRILPEDPEAVFEDLRTKELPSLQIRAQQSKEQERRGHYATKALKLCIAMGDLALYDETLRWAGQKFKKDPLTVKELFDDSVMNLTESVDMLVALDERPREMKDIKDSIQKANRVLVTLIETATEAQREPSFSLHHWDFVLWMPGHIAACRLSQLDKWQKRMDVSDSDLFENILLPTMEMLLKVEEALLQPDCRRLHQQNPGGPLSGTSVACTSSTSKATIQFLDRLAQRRDELWRRHRSQTNPAVLSLGAPWPRGLPIQSLLSVNFASHQGLRGMLFAKMPYIQSRAEAVVFCDPELALAPIPESEEDQTAIGPFIESWTNALEFWLIGAEDEQDRENRALRAWEYATTKLTGGRMTPNEAHRFWKPYSHFWSELAQLSEPVTKREMPSLSQLDSSERPSEWNPDPSYEEREANVKNRRLPTTTCLDCMLQSKTLLGESWMTARTLTETSEPVIPGIPLRKDYWTFSKENLSKVSTSKVDAAGAASVLCLNSLLGADTSLLLNAFPSDSDPRFPALYLEEGFLEKEGQNIGPPLEVLQSLFRRLPSSLLAKLAGSMLQRIQAQESESLRDYTVFTVMIKLLACGEDPILAEPLIRRFIVEIPEASAWHRRVLDTNIVQFLDPKGCEKLLQSLAADMIHKLKKQASKAQTGSTKIPISTAPSAATVKVTTVKMLARILHGGLFLGPKPSLDILVQLLAHACHIDIRIAALESLVDMSRNADIKQAVLSELRTYAVPLAGTLNECRPVTEADWRAAEEQGELPTIGHGKNDHRAYDLLTRGNEENNPELYSLAYEAMQLSGHENKRWMLFFMKKHGVDINTPSVQNLPPIPAMPRSYATLFMRTRASQLPKSHYETMMQFITLLNDPPPEITQLTAYVKSRDSLQRSNEGEHWLSIWDEHERNGLLFGLHVFLNKSAEFARLQREGHPSAVTSDMVDELVLRIVEARLVQGDTDFCLRILSFLGSPYDHEARCVREDMGPGRIMRRLVDKINSLRTPAWQADPHRQPPFLPSTLEFELALLPVHTKKTPIEDIVSFAGAIVALLDKIASSGMPYDERIDKVEHTLNRSIDWCLRLACLFGSPCRLSSSSSPTSTDFLRVHMAQRLLCGRTSTEGCAEEDVADAKKMVEEWEAGPIEEFRLVARRLRGKGEKRSNYDRTPAPKWLREEQE